MIKGSYNDLNTVYTAFKHAQMVSDLSEQDDAVITSYVAIQAKDLEIKIKFPEELSNTVVHLGGLQIALNYLSLLGKKFRFNESAFENI